MTLEASPLTRANLTAFRKDLKALGPAWPKEVTKVNKVISTKGADKARARAVSLGAVWRRNADAIKPRATAAFGAIRIAPSTARGSTTAGATAAFWGSDQRSGWNANAAHAIAGGKPQHPRWVGNTWEAGVKGQGPYAINDALVDYGPELLEDWGHGIDDLTRRAFPNR